MTRIQDESENALGTSTEGRQIESFDQARAGAPDVSPSISVIWKPLHRLLQYDDGNPIDPVTLLSYDIEGRHLPFASFSLTRGNRLILWPPSDACETGKFANGRSLAIHHLTLELSNGRTHFTYFDPEGKRLHDDQQWHLADFPDGLKFWLVTAVRVAHLEKQVGALEQTIRMPTTDSDRREEEFRRYAAAMRQAVVEPPPLRGDCLVTVFLIVPGEAPFRGPIRPSHFPMGKFWNEWIDGWPDGDNFQIAPTGINVGGVNLILLTAAPLGRLKGACFLGGNGWGAPDWRARSTY